MNANSHHRNCVSRIMPPEGVTATHLANLARLGSLDLVERMQHRQLLEPGLVLQIRGPLVVVYLEIPAVSSRPVDLEQPLVARSELQTTIRLAVVSLEQSPPRPVGCLGLATRVRLEVVCLGRILLLLRVASAILVLLGHLATIPEVPLGLQTRPSPASLSVELLRPLPQLAASDLTLVLCLDSRILAPDCLVSNPNSSNSRPLDLEVRPQALVSVLLEHLDSRTHGCCCCVFCCPNALCCGIR